ncbi:MAG: hypothetical protein ACRD96_20025, partial [Bryobacteraceae bacterium]
VWERVGTFREDRWAGDSDLAGRVRRAGVELCFEPRAVVSHRHDVTAGSFLRERMARGRDFGLMRAEGERWGRGRVLFHLMLFPLLPVVMTGRAIRYAGARIVAALPVVVAGNVAWCAGEAAGLAGLAWKR